MVDPVSRVSSTSASAATQIDSSVVSRAEPDNVWAAMRQHQINADLAALKDAREQQEEEPSGDEEASGSLDDRHPHRRQDIAASEVRDEPAEDARLSGESERIGTRNYDDETPFGHRTLII